nr:hypothetical protein [uncultured Mediterranean phage uvMED]|tara:strand:+ start:164 stop:415 length:252 start_codon:yes stop_codon:yes gene_type:complete
MIVRFYRRPKRNDPILELAICSGCVTPKLCKRNGKCDVHYEDQKMQSDLVRKLNEEKAEQEKASAYKSKIVRTSKGRNKKKVL